MPSPYGFLKEAFSVNQADPNQELEWVKQYQQTGDTQAFLQLKKSLRPIIERVINDTKPSGNAMDVSILRMTATAKLPDILTNFDVNQNTKLSTYVFNSLKGNLGNTVKDNISGPKVPRNQQPDLHRYRQAQREAHMEAGKYAPDDLVAKFYSQNGGVTPFENIKQYNVRSLQSDAVFSGGDDEGELMTFQDQFTPKMDDFEPLDSIVNDEHDGILQTKFLPHEQQVITRITKDGQSFAQVALSLGVSTGEIKKIIRRWLKVTNQEV